LGHFGEVDSPPPFYESSSTRSFGVEVLWSMVEDSIGLTTSAWVQPLFTSSCPLILGLRRREERKPIV